MKVAVQEKTGEVFARAKSSDRNLSLEFPGSVGKWQEVYFFTGSSQSTHRVTRKSNLELVTLH